MFSPRQPSMKKSTLTSLSSDGDSSSNEDLQRPLPKKRYKKVLYKNFQDGDVSRQTLQRWNIKPNTDSSEG